MIPQHAGNKTSVGVPLNAAVAEKYENISSCLGRKVSGDSPELNQRRLLTTSWQGMGD
jgi:hypothetical protein